MEFFLNNVLRTELITTNTIKEETENIIKIIPRIHQQENMLTIKTILNKNRNEFLMTTKDDKIPFYFPNIKQLKIQYINEMIYIHYVPSNEPPTIKKQHQLSSNEMLQNQLSRITNRLIKFLNNEKYEKRMHHDQIVPKATFQDHYLIYKQKYKYWVEKWGSGNQEGEEYGHMTTDPQKHVYEDLQILSFLTILLPKDIFFIDLGCGNGFLSYLLNEEGYEGYGLDLRKRKIWSCFKHTRLIESTFQPLESILLPTGEFINCDWRKIISGEPFAVDFDQKKIKKEIWLIGNHADELTCWFPLLCALSNTLLPSTKFSFFLLPCCFFDLNGKRNPFGSTIPNMKSTKYDSYLCYIEDMMTQLGFKVERENLRIPSTKNKCLIGREWRADKEETFHVIYSYIRNVDFKTRGGEKKKSTAKTSTKELFQFDSEFSHFDLFEE